MRIGTKFALAYLSCSLLALGAYAFIAARREMRDLEATATTDLLAMGQSLAPAMAAVWDREGEARARELVERAGTSRREVVVRWVASRAETGLAYEAWVEPSDAGRRVAARVRIVPSGGQRAALELSRDIPTETTLLRAELRDELLIALIVAVLSAVLAKVLGGWLIERPLGRITAQLDRIGAGDLPHRMMLRGSREIYELKIAINSTCDRLEEAHARADAEAAARVAAVEQLRHADRLSTVGTLSSGIAHELGTPLNVILMRARMVARGEVTGAEIAENAEIIAGQTERVAKIVRQLLDFARRRAPFRAEVDVGELVRKTTTLLSSLAKKVGVGLSVDADQPVRARVDGGQIEQAVTNLIVNAVQASGPGKCVCIRASLEGTNGERRAVVEVTDQGMGMAPEVAERVFEPFFTTKGVGEGTGLGLAVVHGIVQDHGGEIRLRTAPGAGSSIAILLPLEPQKEGG